MRRDSSISAGFDEMEIRIFKDTGSTYRADILSPYGERISSKLPAVPMKALSASTNPQDYGRQLYKWLFRGDIEKIFLKIINLTTNNFRDAVSDLGLRFRLWLDPDSKELQCINWETLCEPDSAIPISMRVALSRFLRVSIAQTQPIPDRSMRMLIIASNPKDRPLVDFGNTLNYLQEIVKSGSSNFYNRLKLDIITEPPTLGNLLDAIEDVRMIHFFGQSTWFNDQRCLILSDKNGMAERVPYETIVDMMTAKINKMPSLVFISVPCLPDEYRIEMEDFLGPSLVRIGALAVVSIEAPMDPSALHDFTAQFYRVLSNTGIVDEAVARARKKIYSTGWDWSAPVLYTRAQDDSQIIKDVDKKPIQKFVIRKRTMSW